MVTHRNLTKGGSVLHFQGGQPAHDHAAKVGKANIGNNDVPHRPCGLCAGTLGMPSGQEFNHVPLRSL